jgi:hypothetical protein
MQSDESHAFSTAIGDGTARLDPYLNTLIIIRAILTVNPSAARKGAGSFLPPSEEGNGKREAGLQRHLFF